MPRLPSQIGEVLGLESDFALATLAAFARRVDFRGKDFTGAIRAFLARFRLPGEAQKIDRILEAFAEAYFECLTSDGDDGECYDDEDSGEGKSGGASAAAGVVGANEDLQWMSSAETLHVLAFSTIMLNTDAHNPAMKGRERMTLDQFVRNNRGIDGGRDVPRQVLPHLHVCA